MTGVLIFLVIVVVSVIAVVTLNRPVNAPAVPNTDNTGLPVWVTQLYSDSTGQAVKNPPNTITKCLYNNQIVYYVEPGCCDQFNTVYNESGTILCAPSGGFTGAGDGRCTDFTTKKADCQIVWNSNK